ncbi:hypothetical protein [uncultured Maribacter sp.]|uniref:hypothetical protein n=1 Tax=uncultured Maribacter sp. TaxID=431308 RepID=UPI002623991E|nr:hypothetical protein [uncultured Maribacter sp.]
MKVTYNQQEETIEIEDKTKIHIFLFKILTLVIIWNAGLHVYLLNNRSLSSVSYAWIFISILSLITLLFLIFKKSSLEKIPLERIRGLKRKDFFGRRSLSLILKNGKSRDIIYLKNQSEIAELNKTISAARITTIDA